MSLYVLLETLDGTWERLGTDRHPQGFVEGINPTYNAAGPDGLSFTIQRPLTMQPDLLPFTPVELWSTGYVLPLWSGYTVQAPGAGTARTVNVSCQGWQWYLDEAQAAMSWINSRQGDWQDHSQPIESKPIHMASAIQAGTDSDNAVRITFPAGSTIVNSTYGGVMLDLGEGNGADRAVVEVEDSANAGGEFWYLISNGAPFWVYGDVGGSGVMQVYTFNAIPLSSGGPIIRNSATLARRYRFWHLIMGGGASSPATDIWVRFKRIMVGKSAYITATPGTIQSDPTWSRLNADDVFRDVRAAMLPMLSADESRITSVSFNIPHFHFPEVTPSRELLKKAADYHGYNWGVDADKRLFFEPQPAAPSLYVNAQDPGVEFQDQSSNDAAELWNIVRVSGRDGAGYPLLAQFHAADFIGGYRDTSSPGYTGVNHTNPSAAVNVAGWHNADGTDPTRDTGTFDSSPASFSIVRVFGQAVAYTDGFTGTFKAGVPYRLGVAFGFQVTSGVAAFGWMMRWRVDFGVLTGFSYPEGNRYSTYTEDYVAPPAAVSTVTTVMGTNTNVARRVTWVPDRDYPASQVQARFQMLLVQPTNAHTWNKALIDSLSLEEGITTTAVERRNRRRPFKLDVGPPTDMTTMRALAQQWLLSHRTVPLKGSLTITGDAANTGPGGSPVPAEALGRYHGKLVRIVGTPDPDTGANSRDALITNISGTDPVQLSLDNTPRGFDALLARAAATAGLD